MIRHRKKFILRKFTARFRLKTMKITKMKDREEREILKQFNFPVYDLPLSTLDIMKSQQRKALRRLYKSLPAYMLMTKREKKLFFKRKAKQYERKISKMPQKQKKIRKSVQFEEEHDVKLFSKEQSASCVRKTPAFKELYSFQHFRV